MCMWFKSLWQTFGALVAKIVHCRKVRVFCLETFCQNYYLKNKKVMGPTITYKNFIFILLLIIYYYYLFQFCQVGGSATVHKRSAQIFFSLGVTGGE